MSTITQLFSPIPTMWLLYIGITLICLAYSIWIYIGSIKMSTAFIFYREQLAYINYLTLRDDTKYFYLHGLYVRRRMDKYIENMNKNFIYMNGYSPWVFNSKLKDIIMFADTTYNSNDIPNIFQGLNTDSLMYIYKSIIELVDEFGYENTIVLLSCWTNQDHHPVTKIYRGM